MTRRLGLYVVAVVAAGCISVLLGSTLNGAVDYKSLLFWAAICLIGEALWLRTMEGQATWAMTPTFHLAMALLFNPALFQPVIFITRALGDIIFRRSPWYKALFNGAQFTISATCAWAMYTLVAGGSPVSLQGLTDPRTLAPLIALGATHFVLNTSLVSVAVALDQKQSIFHAWRRNFGYRSEAASSGTQFVMAVLLASLYQWAGYVAAALFLVPLLAIRLADMRYIELQKTHQVLVRSARMAAKGEMAAEVAHEMNNYLAALSGRAQLLMMGLEKGKTDRIDENLNVILDQAERMSVLTKGLVDFSHKGMKPVPTDVGALVERTVQFVKPQNRFDGVCFKVSLDRSVPPTMLDPGQVQQVLMNLFTNAADAMKANPEGKAKIIEVNTKSLPTKKQALIEVIDTGPGISESLIERVFEPTFTTKDTGHGFGLSTSYRIIENHGGDITIESHEDKGAVFHLTLPIKKPRKLAKAA
jgi:signal transduction histidine kinase